VKSVEKKLGRGAGRSKVSLCSSQRHGTLKGPKTQILEKKKRGGKKGRVILGPGPEGTNLNPAAGNNLSEKKYRRHYFNRKVGKKFGGTTGVRERCKGKKLGGHRQREENELKTYS